jgi:hypothetical protein
MALAVGNTGEELGIYRMCQGHRHADCARGLKDTFRILAHRQPKAQGFEALFGSQNAVFLVF